MPDPLLAQGVLPMVRSPLRRGQGETGPETDKRPTEALANPRTRWYESPRASRHGLNLTLPHELLQLCRIDHVGNPRNHCGQIQSAIWNSVRRCQTHQVASYGY